MASEIHHLVILIFIAIVAGLSGCLEDELLEIYSTPITSADGGDVSGIKNSSGEDCAADDQPTWDGTISRIISKRCDGSCHYHTGIIYDYDQVIAEWLADEALWEEYIKRGSEHFLPDEQEQETCLRWAEIGAPKSACEVTAE